MDQTDNHGNVYIKAEEVDFAHGLSMGDVGLILMTLETLYETMKGDVRAKVVALHTKVSDAQERCANDYMRKLYPKHAAAIFCKAADVEAAKKEHGLP